jgi:hypothetical protein
MNWLKRETTAKRGLGSWYGLATCLLLCCLVLLAAGAGRAEAQVPPTLAVTFTPPQVPFGGSETTTLTATASNPNGTILAHVAFSNTYPTGVVPDAISSFTCGTEAGSAGGTFNFTPTGFSVEANEIPAGSSCDVVVLMHATSPGSFLDTTSTVTSFDTSDGAAASATLTATVPVPSLGSWGLIGFGLLLGAAAYRAARRRSACDL